MEHVVRVTNNWQNMKQHRICCLLSRLIPGARVVKAFNTLSAWALQNGPSDASRQVMKISVCDFLFILTILWMEKCI